MAAIDGFPGLFDQQSDCKTILLKLHFVTAKLIRLAIKFALLQFNVLPISDSDVLQVISEADVHAMGKAETTEVNAIIEEANAANGLGSPDHASDSDGNEKMLAMDELLLHISEMQNTLYRRCPGLRLAVISHQNLSESQQVAVPKSREWVEAYTKFHFSVASLEDFVKKVAQCVKDALDAVRCHEAEKNASEI
ncbi:hypothetical protein H2200_004537 [Cladophialophora chaetospira]|uniref:Uncharacterized protein n=1 Tax=Cladophialophora chaetospira TaxID=386627 RepID=A0AA38XDA4_9EURO|nr:hypothetical protein H2200_004537 [Cladophialophora chaetospira]